MGSGKQSEFQADQRADVPLVATSGPVSKAKRQFPKRFYAWCLVKTLTQITLSAMAISFIVSSNFFVPGAYDASVWSPDDVRLLYLPQGMFEVFDLVSELWMLRKQSDKAHLPWDSIIHHLVAASYAFYIYAYAYELDTNFLGLAVAAIGCQVIGPLYNLHRLRLRFRGLPHLILLVQTCWRIPLAVVSVIRAVQFFFVAPWAHFFICLVLARLDYRWTIWAYKLVKREEAARKMNKNKKQTLHAAVNSELEFVSEEAKMPLSSTMPSQIPLAAQHLKSL